MYSNILSSRFICEVSFLNGLYTFTQKKIKTVGKSIKLHKQSFINVSLIVFGLKREMMSENTYTHNWKLEMHAYI